MKRFWLVFTFICLGILITFALWGASWEQRLHPETTSQWLSGFRYAAGPIGVALLLSDLLLPIPTTVVIAAMGASLGFAQGVFWGWLGLTCAGQSLLGLAGARWG